MKVTLHRDELVRALFCVQGIVERRPLVPINGHALFEAKGGELKLSATDGEVSLAAKRPAQVTTGASMAVPARQLYDIAKSLPAADVHLGRKDGGLHVVCGASAFRLATLPADTFPALPSASAADTWTMPAATLSRMLERALSCVSNDESRHNLSGVFFEAFAPEGGADAEGVRLVSTDGHRMALVEATVPGNRLGKDGLLLPRKGLRELRRVLLEAEKDADVTVGTIRQGAVFTCGQVTLTTQAINAVFPDYRQVLPTPGEKQATFDRGLVLDAIRRVSLVSPADSHGIRLKFSEGELTLEAEDATMGEARESVPVLYDGAPCTVGFNCRYLSEALGLMDKGEARLNFVDEISPGLLTPAEGGGFTALIMPMRV